MVGGSTGHEGRLDRAQGAARPGSGARPRSGIPQTGTVSRWSNGAMTPTRAGGARADAPPGDTLHAVLAAEALRSVFQPLVRLRDGALVGYELLARGPAGHRLEAPLDLLV